MYECWCIFLFFSEALLKRQVKRRKSRQNFGTDEVETQGLRQDKIHNDMQSIRRRSERLLKYSELAKC